MPLIEGLKIGDGIVIKDINGAKFYTQVVKFAYKGYKVKIFGNKFGEIKRVDQCDVIRRMTDDEENNNYEITHNSCACHYNFSMLDKDKDSI